MSTFDLTSTIAYYLPSFLVLSLSPPLPPPLSTHTDTASSPTTTSSPHSSPLVVKVRVSGSGEPDFVEAEVAPPTYSALVSACCVELDLTTSDVAKVRKLPNVLVRKDRDVQRMRDGQELELVLKNEISSGGVVSMISPPAAAASYPTTSMLTVNPFAPPNAAVLALSGQVQVQRGSPVASVGSDGLILKPEENGTGTQNHIPGLTSDSAEVPNHAHNHTHPTAAVNGLQ